jgi:hypothetical protein
MMPLGEPEAEPCAFASHRRAGGFAAEPDVEHARRVLGRDSAAGIRHADGRHGGLPVSEHLDDAARAGLCSQQREGAMPRPKRAGQWPFRYLRAGMAAGATAAWTGSHHRCARSDE